MPHSGFTNGNHYAPALGRAGADEHWEGLVYMSFWELAGFEEVLYGAAGILPTGQEASQTSPAPGRPSGAFEHRREALGIEAQQ